MTTDQATRTVSWGEGIVVAAYHAPRGLNGAAQRVREVVGEHIGTRVTLSKFVNVSDPATLKPRDRFRAWLMLAALGQTPSEWGIPDSDVPAGYDVEQIRSLLTEVSDTNRYSRSAAVSDTNQYSRTSVDGAIVLPFRRSWSPFVPARESLATVLPFPTTPERAA